MLLVAHREEILVQAAETYLRIRPKSRVGFFLGQVRDVEVDVLCASVQTLSRLVHLERFSPQHFDYIVFDEFHHAATTTYRRVLNYFAPRFLLGLTATPDRTDQSDILSLCDDNLVFSRDLFAGIKCGLLAPFHYHGIYDDSVDYREIPWRSGRFDIEQLFQQTRHLGACMPCLKGMAAQFVQAGVVAAAVYSGSALSRGDALRQLRDGRLAVIFSVDLFGYPIFVIDRCLCATAYQRACMLLRYASSGFGHERKLVLAR